MATPVTEPHPQTPAAQGRPLATAPTRVAGGQVPGRGRTVRQAPKAVHPGLHLRAAVQRVLADPAGPSAVAELMAGLAWTAAAGETCLLTRPVADVRRAIAAIAVADTPAARAALDHAAAALLDVPALPVPRPATAFERRSI
ncbi:hypothetical protein [Actinokineospora terrae]|uniref:Uncharacterized protein n=1 Tax=Actinokineospora terrae TaxID=155974 RepID=A0A1H9V286_9PSEU|nr:hypothetical protein [Actinokineospora terrae]SES15930.1 hypothetical protein SAMN04487818_10814 [Actinokineospora terrae]